MQKVHCDHCDKVVESYRRWVELRTKDGKELIVHLQAKTGSQDEGDYCAECWSIILQVAAKAALEK